MAGKVYGLDLGTYEIKVFDKKNDSIWHQKNAIAMKNRKYIFAVGNEAYDIFEKAPADIRVVFPMRSGVIAHFDDMPTDVTEVEKKAFYDLVLHSQARAKSVRIVEKGLADAVGFGMDVTGEKGIFVANFGGGTTELSVLSLGGMVMNRLLKIGGGNFDASIADLVRHNREFMIGTSTAEKLRCEFGIFDQSTGSSIRVSGRDLVAGVPSQSDIPISLVRAAMKEPLEECVRAIRSMIDRTPPDVRRAIEAKGIYLTGGIANLRGLTTYLEGSIGLPVMTVPNPELCAVKGLQKIILHKAYYKKLTYSMLDENYRWLR